MKNLYMFVLMDCLFCSRGGYAVERWFRWDLIWETWSYDSHMFVNCHSCEGEFYVVARPSIMITQRPRQGLTMVSSDA